MARCSECNANHYGVDMTPCRTCENAALKAATTQLDDICRECGEPSTVRYPVLGGLDVGYCDAHDPEASAYYCLDTDDPAAVMAAKGYAEVDEDGDITPPRV